RLTVILLLLTAALVTGCQPQVIHVLITTTPTPPEAVEVTAEVTEATTPEVTVEVQATTEIVNAPTVVTPQEILPVASTPPTDTPAPRTPTVTAPPANFPTPVFAQIQVAEQLFRSEERRVGKERRSRWVSTCGK